MLCDVRFRRALADVDVQDACSGIAVVFDKRRRPSGVEYEFLFNSRRSVVGATGMIAGESLDSHCDSLCRDAFGTPEDGDVLNLYDAGETDGLTDVSGESVQYHSGCVRVTIEKIGQYLFNDMKFFVGKE